MKKKMVIEVQYWKRTQKYFIYATCKTDIYKHIGYLYCNTFQQIIHIDCYEYNENKDYDATYLRPDWYTYSQGI